MTIQEPARGQEDKKSSSLTEDDHELVEDLQVVLRKRLSDKEKQFRDASIVDAAVADHRRQIAELEASPAFMSEEAMEDLSLEIDALTMKLERVQYLFAQKQQQKLLRQQQQQDDYDAEDVACCVCLEVPEGAVLSCQGSCESLLCARCAAACTECPVCRVSYHRAPPKRNRWAEKLAAKARRRMN